jgi:mercuric ion transport protein
VNDRPHIAIGVTGAIFVALCCAAPLLAGALASASLTAWLANSYSVLVPAAIIFFALVALLLYRSWTATRDHRDLTR